MRGYPSVRIIERPKVPFAHEYIKYQSLKTNEERTKYIFDLLRYYLLATHNNRLKLIDLGINWEYFEPQWISIDFLEFDADKFFACLAEDDYFDKSYNPKFEEEESKEEVKEENTESKESELISIKPLICSSCGSKLDAKKMVNHIIHCDACDIDNFISVR